MDLVLTVNHYGASGLRGNWVPLLNYGVIFSRKCGDSLAYGASGTIHNASGEKVIDFVSDYLSSRGKNNSVELECRSYEKIDFGVLSFKKPFPRQVRHQLEAIVRGHNESVIQSHDA